MLAKPCVGAVSKFDERNPGGERRNRGFEWRDGGVNWRICPRGQRLAPRETVSSSVSDLPHSDVCRAATCGKASVWHPGLSGLSLSGHGLGPPAATIRRRGLSAANSESDLPHSAHVCRAATCKTVSRRQRRATYPRHWPPLRTSRAESGRTGAAQETPAALHPSRTGETPMRLADSTHAASRRPHAEESAGLRPPAQALPCKPARSAFPGLTDRSGHAPGHAPPPCPAGAPCGDDSRAGCAAGPAGPRRGSAGTGGPVTLLVTGLYWSAVLAVSY